MRNALIGLFLFTSAVLSGCITSTYRAPELEADSASATQSLLQREAVEFQLQRRARLYDLSWPLLAGNTPLCPVTRKSIGIILADLEVYGDLVGGFKPEQLESLGIADELHVLHVIKDSPAEAAGLRSGTFIRAVNGESLSGEKPKEVTRAIARAVKDGEEVSIRVSDGTEEMDISIKAAEVCDVAVKMSSSSSLNAVATDKTIAINAGLMRNGSDEMVQFVMGHELAHVALRHPRKGTYNTIVSGAVVYAPLLYTGGAIADRTLRLFRIKPKRSLALSGLSVAVPFSQDFEAEADYVGLYMVARAGGDIDNAHQFFELLAREAPSSTWIRYTHPLTPERVTTLNIAVKEIKAKQETGEDLLPEKRR